MERILITWIGSHDLAAVEGVSPGPIYAAIQEASSAGRPFKAFHFLYNYAEEEVRPYREWLSEKLPPDAQVSYSPISLSSPSAYQEIYPAAERILVSVDQNFPNFQRTVHLSPGTPAMTAVWILLVKTRFPSVCIESWYERGTGRQHVNSVELPFEIDARFTNEAIDRSDDRLVRLNQEEGEIHDAFKGIVTEGGLGDALRKAKKMAIRDVPVLLLGETGTGKEVFAEAIHRGSRRSNGTFVAVNCGALPRELAESLLFGHKKGAFTGAHRDHPGFFAQADGGTLFLDEIGELGQDLQVKLLRALQEKTYTPVGGAESQNSDFRIIAATHRDLMQRVAEGSFREDLFYRLAVGVIKLPALRSRPEDLNGLVDFLIEQINDELADQSGYQRKNIGDSVRKLIVSHSWPGNIRELRSTLLRAAVWSEDNVIEAEAFEEAILTLPTSNSGFLANEITQPIDINELSSEVERHFIPLALKQTGGNKTKAAKLLGLKSQQVLTNKMEKLGI